MHTRLLAHLLQVGNAVPPPLSHALGMQLRKVLAVAREDGADDALAAQRAALAAAKAAKKKKKQQEAAAA